MSAFVTEDDDMAGLAEMRANELELLLAKCQPVQS
jgi:hypothetical protein